MRRLSFFRSSVVRVTLLYAAIFAGSAVALMGFVVWSATGYMARQIDNTAANELAELQSDADDGSDAAIKRVVETLIVHSPGVFYLLQDAKGGLIAGNMQPIHPRPGPRVLESTHQAQPGHSLGGIRGRGVLLSSGSYLFVGLSTFELGEMQEVVAHAALWGLAATTLIALVGGLATSLWLLRRIDAISLASREIMAGDLGRRVALHGNGDEFDRLAAGLNAMLDRIQELMRGLQQVSSDIAHDLRTPLTRLRQRLELARRRSRSVAEYQAAIDAAIGDSEAMLDLFAALLRIAQIESGTRRAGFASVDLSEVLADLAEAYTPELEAAGQTLTTNIEPGLALHGDRQLLAQLFANLIENAVRHCPIGTHVRLEALRDAGAVRVSLSDDGPGVPEESREELFRPFSRLERSRTTAGSGLGLSLAAAVATLHDARLLLEDAKPGLRCIAVFPARSRI